jgi:hypothetical protein
MGIAKRNLAKRSGMFNKLRTFAGYPHLNTSGPEVFLTNVM